MRKLLAAALALCAVASVAGAVFARSPAPDSIYAPYDARAAQSWADKLVLCDVTAFLAGRPDLNANRIWVRRDDGHSDLLLPPDFVTGPFWYKEGYQRLYDRLRRAGKVDRDQLVRAQDTLGRGMVEAYRRSPAYGDRAFLQAQDRYCRAMARGEGEIIS